MMTDNIIRRAYPLGPVAKTAKKQQGGFQKGESGNPKGRPCGSRNKATLAARAPMEGDLETITQALVDKAKAGEAWAVKLLMYKLVPNCRDLPVSFKSPKMASPGDLKEVMANVLMDTAKGRLTPSEALAVSQVVMTLGITQAVEDLEKKLMSIGR
jgi:Family of unknown function (DUF5681)